MYMYPWINGLHDVYFTTYNSGGTILQVKSGNEASLTSGDDLVAPTHADEMAVMLVFTYAST